MRAAVTFAQERHRITHEDTLSCLTGKPEMARQRARSGANRCVATLPDGAGAANRLKGLRTCTSAVLSGSLSFLKEEGRT